MQQEGCVRVAKDQSMSSSQAVRSEEGKTEYARSQNTQGRQIKRAKGSQFAEYARLIVCEAIEDTDTDDHDKQPDGYYDKQYEAKPAEYHGRSADSRFDTAVS